jgi:uncharacterized protein (TIGR00369 family)
VTKSTKCKLCQGVRILSETALNTHGWRELPIPGFMSLIGPLRSCRKDGRKTYSLQTTARHENAIGVIHGGVITSLLDQVLAMEAWNAADRAPTVTVQMDTRFLSSATSGDLLEAMVTIRHATRSMMFVDGEITADGALIATATSVMKIIRKAS